MRLYDYLYFTKFIPDCKSSSFISCIDTIADPKDTIFMPLNMPTKLILAAKYNICRYLSRKLFYHFKVSTCISGSRSSAGIRAYLTEIPYIIVCIDISETKFTYTDSKKLLADDVFDIIDIVQPNIGKYQIIGKIEWLYIREKLENIYIINHKSCFNKIYSCKYDFYNFSTQLQILRNML